MKWLIVDFESLDFISKLMKIGLFLCAIFVLWTFLYVPRNMRRHLTAEEAARAVEILQAGDIPRGMWLGS